MRSLESIMDERGRTHRNAAIHWIEYSIAIGVPHGGDAAAALKAAQQGVFWAPRGPDSWRARRR